MGLPLMLPVTSRASELTTESVVMEDTDASAENVVTESSDLVVPGLDSWCYEIDDTAKIIYLTRYTGNYERIKVPATYTINGQQYAVRLKAKRDGISMGMGIFASNTLKEVEFEDGVSRDFARLFYYCTGL